jgi:hypothetical protein
VSVTGQWGRAALAALGVAAVAGLHASPARASDPSAPSTGPPATSSLPASAPAAGAPPTGPSGADTTTTLGQVPIEPPTSPGLFDLPGRVRAAVNDWFRELVTAALNPTLDLLGRSVLATPDVTAAGGRVRELWWASAGVANSAFVLLILAGGLLVMGHETVQTRYSVKEIAPRLVVAFLAANVSLTVVGQAIELTNGVSRALLGQGVDPAHTADTIKRLTLAPLDSGGIFLTLLTLVIAVLALALVLAYVVRVVLLTVLVAGAPIALACHALPQTDGLAQLWWRALAACLGVQVGQSLVLIAALRVFFETDRPAVLGLDGNAHLVDLLVVLCLLWVLVRIPTWAGRAVFTGRGRRSMLVGLAKSYVLLGVARRVLRRGGGGDG